MDPYSGEASRAQEAFLAQSRLCAKQKSVLDTESASQWILHWIGKLAGPAQSWHNPAFANDPAASTEAQITLGLRKACSVRCVLASGPSELCFTSLPSRRRAGLSAPWPSTSAGSARASRGSLWMPGPPKPASAE